MNLLKIVYIIYKKYIFDIKIQYAIQCILKDKEAVQALDAKLKDERKQAGEKVMSNVFFTIETI